MIICF